MNPLQIDLSDQIAIITGASGELGRVMARTLARCGAHIAIHYHSNKTQAETLCREIRDYGVQSIIVQADITDADAILAMRDVVVESLGDPHIVINNAVALYQWRSVLEQPLADYESQFRSCVQQSVMMAKAFAPAMIARQHGRIIATSTHCVMQNHAKQSAYVSGKRGMDGVLRVLAHELGEHQITVNQVAPGWTNSERVRAGLDGSNPDYAQSVARYESQVPMRRMGTDQEVANVVAFLASDLASYVNGVFIPVSGGTIMPGI